MDLTFSPEQVLQIVVYTLAMAGLYFTLKAGVNGARKDIASIKEGVDKLLASDTKQNDHLAASDNRLTKLEAEYDASKGWTRRVEERVKELAGIVDRRLNPRSSD